MKKDAIVLLIFYIIAWIIVYFVLDVEWYTILKMSVVGLFFVVPIYFLIESFDK